MPLQRCQINGKFGWKWGQRGKCYTGPTAKLRAVKQAIAIREAQKKESAGQKDQLPAEAISTSNSALAANARKRNPLRVDPTRTTLLRRRFAAAISHRLRWLKGEILRLIVDEDALGLRRDEQRIRRAILGNQDVIFGNQSKRWANLTDARKVEEFRQWVDEQVKSGVLQATDADSAEWMSQYIREAYEKGQGRAFDDAKRKYAQEDQSLDFYQGTRQEFLDSAFRRPVSQERLKQLIGRTFDELRGMTEVMKTQLSRTLADGLIQGDSPLTIARRLNKEIDGINRRRARTIARTEIIRAHNEGQLDALEQLGVTELGVMVEWSTAEDNAVCPLCVELDGIVVKITEARGMIPRHPNCRCAWVPANVGEPVKGQKRSKRDIKEAIDASILKEVSAKRRDGTKRTKKERIDESRWIGADKTITKKRPEPVVSPK